MNLATARAFVGIVLLGCSALGAQEFEFGTDLVGGVESGRAGGGFATAYMDFAIAGNQLTAVLRNTSPDSENYGGNSAIGSPAVRRVDFDVFDVVGGNLALTGWELTARDGSNSAVILGNDNGGGLDDWRMFQKSSGAYRVKSRGSGGTPDAPLYSPAATGGFAAGAQYFTEAVLTATFNATIGSSDLNPEIRFKYLGINGIGRSLTGIPLNSMAQPEPGSIFVWTGLLAAVGFRRRRRRPRGELGTAVAV